MLGDEIKQSDIFTKKERIVADSVERINKLESNIPEGFISVKFSSRDKFCPEVLHFRNYSMGEIYEMTSATQENQARIIINRVLNNMCFEKFDCSKLPPELIQEIMVTIYANFWGKYLPQRPYYIDPDREDVDAKENIAYTDVLISKINTFDINPKFKNPFSISYGNKKVTFCVQTMGNSFIAEDYVKGLYSEKEQKYSSLKSKLAIVEDLNNSGKFEEASKINIDSKLKEEYDNFENEKSASYLKALQAQALVAIDGKKLETLEEKIDALVSNKVDIDFWGVYNKTIEENKFGINDMYTFIDSEGKEITRRFSFRLVDLLPSMDKKEYTGYSVHFDD